MKFRYLIISILVLMIPASESKIDDVIVIPINLQSGSDGIILDPSTITGHGTIKLSDDYFNKEMIFDIRSSTKHNVNYTIADAEESKVILYVENNVKKVVFLTGETS